MRIKRHLSWVMLTPCLALAGCEQGVDETELTEPEYQAAPPETVGVGAADEDQLQRDEDEVTAGEEAALGEPEMETGAEPRVVQDEDIAANQPKLVERTSELSRRQLISKLTRALRQADLIVATRYTTKLSPAEMGTSPGGFAATPKEEAGVGTATGEADDVTMGEKPQARVKAIVAETLIVKPAKQAEVSGDPTALLRIPNEIVVYERDGTTYLAYLDLEPAAFGAAGLPSGFEDQMQFGSAVDEALGITTGMDTSGAGIDQNTGADADDTRNTPGAGTTPQDQPGANNQDMNENQGMNNNQRGTRNRMGIDPGNPGVDQPRTGNRAGFNEPSTGNRAGFNEPGTGDRMGVDETQTGDTPGMDDTNRRRLENQRRGQGSDPALPGNETIIDELDQPDQPGTPNRTGM